MPVKYGPLPPPPTAKDFVVRRIVGLDLGRQQDFTALAFMEWFHNTRPQTIEMALTKPVYQVKTLHRFPLGTPYATITEKVVKFLNLPAVAGAILVVDATGCGIPVCEMLQAALIKANTKAIGARGFVAVTITGGHEATLVANGQWHVPKKTLVSVLRVLFGSRRLQIAPSLPEGKTLIKELQVFKVKITTAGNEQFEAWRERDHDDLVLAVLLAAWGAETLRWGARL